MLRNVFAQINDLVDFQMHALQDFLENPFDPLRLDGLQMVD